MKVVKEEKIKINGGEIPIRLCLDNDDEGEFYAINIDGVEWLVTETQMHASVLFNMMREHITEYMHYELTKEEDLHEENFYKENAMRNFIISFLTSVMNCDISLFASEDYKGERSEYGSIKITGKKNKGKGTFVIQRTLSNGHRCSRIPVNDMPFTKENIEDIANLACENL